MNGFRNLRIGARLALGFGLLLAMLCAAVLLGLQKASTQNDKLAEIVAVNNAEIELANGMLNTLQHLSISLRNTVLLTDEAARAAERSEMQKYRAIYADRLARLEKMFAEHTDTTDEQRAALAQIKERIAAARPHNDRVLALAQQNKVDEAIRVLMADGAPATAKVVEAIEALVRIEEKLNAKAAAEAHDAYELGRTVMIALGALALVVGTVAAWSLTRAIAQPLRLAVHVAETVAAGDLTSRIEAGGGAEPARAGREPGARGGGVPAQRA